VLRTKPRSEYIAARSLTKEGYEHLFPTVAMPQRRVGRQETPLFPGYLFIRWDVDRGLWPSIVGMPGILGFLRFDGISPSVPDEIVGELARRARTINEGGGLWTRFRRGQAVRVVSGTLESLARVVDEPKSASSRVRVLMEFMGQLVSAQVPGGDLRPVAGHAKGGRLPGRRRTRGNGRWIRGLGPRGAATA
jgi:transcriptional antiterminator RfaH